MRYSCMQFVVAVALLAFGLSYAAGISSDQPIGIQSAPVNVTDLAAPDGHIDLSASGTGENQGPLELGCVKLQTESVTDEPAVNQTKVVDSDPDDIFWDNSISPSFPGANGTIYAVTVFRGNLIVAGDFTFIDNTLVHGIASWDGSSWAPLGADDGPSSIHCLTVFNDRLIAGGNQSVSAWDGDSWSSLEIGIPNYTYVDALITYDNKLIVSGSFASSGGIPVNMVAAWDGTRWSSLGTGLGPVNTWNFVGALAVFDGNLVVGGRFSFAGGHPAHNIAVWDGTSWSGLGTGTNDDVYALIDYDGRLAAAGRFDSCGGVAANSIACWDGISWSTLGSGINSDWNGPVMTLRVFGGKLVAGGYFSKAGGAVADFLTAWDGDSWAILKAEPNWNVRAMTDYYGKLVIGGMFTAIGEARPARIASWDGNSWAGLTSAEPGFDAATRALEVFDHKLYAGGDFITAGGAPTDHIACWDGFSWSPVGAGLNGVVTKMMVNDDKLAVAGYFTKAGEVTAGHVAEWDGGNWAPLGSGTPYPIVAMAKYDNALTVADEYVDNEWFPDPLVSESIRAWDGSDWSMIASKTGYGMGVGDLIAFDDKLLMTASFPTEFYGSTAYIFSWDGNSWSNIYVHGGIIGGWIVINDELLLGKVISESWWGGSYYDTLVDRWDGTTWTDMGWDIGGLVRAFAFFDRKLIVGGSFASVEGISANNIAAWNGETWSALGSGTNGPVDRLETYNGTLIVAGNFTMAGDKISPFMAVWTKRETHEVALDIKPGSCPNPINDNSNNGQGKAVVPAAIMGSDVFDVHDIDPQSITLNGISPVRWSYEDVGAPADNSEDDCACSEAGPDGYDDLTLKFYRGEIIASLTSTSEGSAPMKCNSDAPTREEYVVSVTGQMNDGAEFEGHDCVVLIEHGNSKAASGEPSYIWELQDNYPNPFNPSTSIAYTVASQSHVKIEIINILGRKVRTLVDEIKTAGAYRIDWDGRNDNGRSVASGMYFYRLLTDDFIQTKKMLLLK